jgi:hypothetical protein
MFFFAGTATTGAIYCFATAHDFAGDGIPVSGIVRSYHGGKYAKAVVAFTDRQGRPRTAATSDLAGRPRPGEVIRIVYDRKDPTAIADPRLGLGNGYVFAWAMATVATVIDIAVLWIVWRSVRPV